MLEVLVPVESLGERISRLRVAKSWSVTRLAGEANVSLRQVMNIEEGITRDPRLGTIILLARALGVSIGDLTDGLEPPAKKE